MVMGQALCLPLVFYGFCLGIVMLTQQQRYNCAASLAMGSVRHTLAKLRRIEVDEATYNAAEEFLNKIEPLFPVSRDGFIPKKVMALVNQK